MKKKIFITVVLLLVGILIGTSYGFFFTKKEEKVKEIKNPNTVFYYSDTKMTEKFKISYPKEFSKSITTYITDENEGETRNFFFKHKNSDEILFVITVHSNLDYKHKETEKVLTKTEKFLYLWKQSVSDNEHIFDENIKKEYSEIASYFGSIVKSFEIMSFEKTK